MFPLRAIIAEIRGIRAEWHEEIPLLSVRNRGRMYGTFVSEIEYKPDGWEPKGIHIGWREVNDGHQSSP
jgi:hypothetical protein